MRLLLGVLLLFYASFAPLLAEPVEHWFEVRSTHFVVLTDANEKQARRVASQFEEMRSFFHTLIPNATGDSGGPIVVIALRDRKSFQAFEPAAYLARGRLDLSGYFQRAQYQNFILVRLDAEGEHPFATIYHEYTHVMMSKAEWVPLWMNEGLAEFYQNSEIREKEVLLGEPSNNDIVYLREHTLIPLTTLLMVDHASPYYHDDEKGSVFYAESWALMHYIEITDFEKNTNHLRDYALHLSAGEDSVTAAQHAFGDLKLLERALGEYVRQMQFKAFRMNTGFTVDAATLTARPMPTGEVNAVRAEVLVGNGRTKDAETLLAARLRDDPNSAAAHEGIGYLRLRENDIPGAKKGFGEAVTLNSQSYLAHYFFAELSLRENDRDHDAEVETSLRTAIRLQPDFAPAYDALARFYGSRDKKLDEAHMLTLQAVGFDPGNVGYRINAANVLVQMKNLNNAESVLNAAAKIAKTPGEKLEVQMQLQQLAQYRSAVEGSRTAKSEAAGTVQAVPVTTAETAAQESAPGSKVLVFKKVNGRMVGTESEVVALKFPEGEAKGVRHTVSGTIRDVQCSYPSVIAFRVEQAGKTVALYNNNFYKIAFTTANYTPEGDIKPCTDIEGMKARVGYAEVTDAHVAGQAVSIELSR